MTGILKNQPAWTKLGSKGIEPTILAKSLNANPNKVRLDEIKKMPSAMRNELLEREPWLRLPLTLYGNTSIPLRPINKPRDFEEDDGWE
jgi:hypothetical protein